MLRCRDINGLLHDYLEGSLDPDLRRGLDEHLADCAGCHGFLNTYRDTVAVAKELRCEDIPPELQRKLRSFIAEKARHRSFYARIRGWLTGSG